MTKIISISIALVLSISVNAALIGRLAATPGGTDYQAYYDDEANLTWLADANYAATSGYDPYGGLMRWYAANEWAAQLIVSGVSGWRLPNAVDLGTVGCNVSETVNRDCGYNVDLAAGELANLFFNVLGNLSIFDDNFNFIVAGGLKNTGPFINAQSSGYWYATEYAPTTGNAYMFSMAEGWQGNASQLGAYYSWAVQSGDISAVPVPAAVWLLGSGLIGLAGFAKRKKT